MLRRPPQRRTLFADWLHAAAALLVVVGLMTAGGGAGHAHAGTGAESPVMHHAVSDDGNHLADCASGEASDQHDQDSGSSCCSIGLGHCSNAWDNAPGKFLVLKSLGQKCLIGSPPVLQGLSPEVEPRPPRKCVL